MKITMRVEGLADLKKSFEQSGQDARIAGRIAANKALQPALDAVRANAPRDTGLLQSEIVKGVLNGRQARRHDMTVGASIFIKGGKKKKYVNNARNRRSGRAGKSYAPDGPAFYGKFQEFGYTARDGSAVPGKFYMTRGFEANREAMLKLFVANFRPAFEKAVNRRAARAAARLKGSRR